MKLIFKFIIFVMLIIGNIQSYAQSYVYGDDGLLSSHNDILATIGDTYFLKHTDIEPDNVIVSIHIKDKQNNIIVNKQLSKNIDFKLNSKSGELNLSKPAYGFLDSYEIDNLDASFLFISVDYQYFVKNNNPDNKVYYYSLDGGITWISINKYSAVDDTNYKYLKDNYKVVESREFTINISDLLTTDSSESLSDRFLIGIADMEIIDRKVTGNRAFANSGLVNYPKRIIKNGKIQLYYRGLIEGKYLINASLDTERADDDVLSYLDPDTNYAIYGDDSNVSDLSAEADGLLYLLVERDESWLKWGKLQTEFPQQELSNLNRNTSGLGAHYESSATTKYGIADTVVDAYYATFDEKNARNEFLSTGGILYYLRYNNIIEKTLKISIEVRDSVNKNTIKTKNLIAGDDYEIDANSGRLLFWRPIKQYISSGLIVFDDEYEQNNIYIIANYNYSVANKLDKATVAARVQQAVNDDIVVGVQYQNEEFSDRVYKSQGIDTNIHINASHTLDIEVAKSNAISEPPSTSTDGGINWRQLDVSNNDKQEDGLSIKGAIKTPGDDDNLSYYYKKVAENFSENTSTVEAGKELAGFDKKYRYDKSLNLRVKYDIADDLNKTNTRDWQKIGNTVVQANYQINNDLSVITAVNHNTIDKYTKSTNKNNTQNNANLATQADYKYSDKTKFNIRHQLAIAGDSLTQTTIGAVHKPIDNLSIKADTTFINSKGNQSDVAASYKLDNGISLEAGLNKSSDGISTSRIGGGYSAGGVSVNAGLNKSDDGVSTNVGGGYSDGGASIGVGVTQDKAGEFTTDTAGKYTYTTQNNQTYNIAAHNRTDANNNDIQSLALGAKTPIGDNTDVGAETTVSISEKDKRNVISSNISHKINNEQSINAKISQYTQDSANSSGDGYDVEVSGNVDKNWTLSVNTGKGYVQNENDTRDTRINLGLGAAYTKTNDAGEALLKSSVHISRRDDSGDNNRTQHVLKSSIKGKYNKDLTILNTVEWSRTNNMDTNLIEAANNRFDLNFAYRPIEHNVFNNLFKYTWVENIYVLGQSQANSLTADKGHVLSNDVFYKLNRDWQVGGKLALRVSEEKFGGIWYDNRLTLSAALAQYEVVRGTFVSLEFRDLRNKLANDSKQGFVLEVKRRFNDVIEAALGYNFSGYSSDLADLDYNIQGWYIRVTGVLW